MGMQRGMKCETAEGNKSKRWQKRLDRSVRKADREAARAARGGSKKKASVSSRPRRLLKKADQGSFFK